MYVDAVLGSDTEGDGSADSPFKTLTFAMTVADSGEVVQMAAGSYGPDSGEISPIEVPDGVTLRGSDVDDCIIMAGVDVFEGILLGDGSTVETFTLSNRDPVDDENRAGIGISAGGACLIRDVRFNKAFLHSAVRMRNFIESGAAIIEDCAFVVTTELYQSRAMELIVGSNAIVRNCLIQGWRSGIFTNIDSTPLIEHCLITDNRFGIDIYSDIGDDPPFNNIDLGGGARGSEGNNLIQGNLDYGVWNRNFEGPIYARFNTWDNDPPSEGDLAPVDYYAPNGGTWIWE